MGCYVRGMKLNLLGAARELEAELVEVRRDLHRHPELSFREERTAGVVRDRLEALGLEPRGGVGVTGVVAEITSGDGPTIALRADMDALPIQEEGDHPYRSVVPGVMHACGHDAHTAMLLGAARLLRDARAGKAMPPGTVRLLFQPAEEAHDDQGRSGAVRMTQAGAMDGVDAVVGLHVGGHLPAGRLFVTRGTVMAGSETLQVTVRGVASHAAWPDRGVDALALAAQGLVACQQAVSRRISPMEHGVVSFGVMEGGTAPNVVAERVELHGTLRYFRDEVRDALVAAVRASFEMLEHHGATVSVQVGPGYPPVVNDAGVTATLRSAFTELVGPLAVLPMARMMAAEDFAFLAREAPGCFFWLGAALPVPREHHHPTFDIDETALPVGSAALATAALALLAERA